MARATLSLLCLGELAKGATFVGSTVSVLQALSKQVRRTALDCSALARQIRIDFISACGLQFDPKGGFIIEFVFSIEIGLLTSRPSECMDDNMLARCLVAS